MHRIFVVDDHAALRNTFRHIIEKSPDLTVCGTAGAFEDALAAIPEAAPDLVVMDVSLGHGSPDGIELIRRLNRSMKGRQPRWVVVSLHADEHVRRRAREAGAQEFLPKEETSAMLLETICDVLEGEK